MPNCLLLLGAPVVLVADEEEYENSDENVGVPVVGLATVDESVDMMML